MPAPPRRDPPPARDPRSVLSRPVSLPDLVLRWADHDDGVADVWLPPRCLGADAGPAPLLYAVHGGFWKQAYDRRHLRPLAQSLSGQGWAVVVPEYARAGGRHAAAGLDVPWELLVDDLRTVRRRAPHLLAEVVPGRVAVDRPVLVGHSAGGQLALWWALDASREHGAQMPVTSAAQDEGSAPGDQRPRHVLALSPVADLARARAEHLGDCAVDGLLGAGAGVAAGAGVGAGAGVAARAGVAAGAGVAALADADTAARLRAGERPANCTLTILHGADDDAVPVGHSTDLAADVPGLDLEVLAGVEHFGLIDPLSSAWPAVLAALPRPDATSSQPDAT